MTSAAKAFRLSRAPDAGAHEAYVRELGEAWAAAMHPRASDALTVVSLFAGGGGSSLGYRMAGADVRLAVEWDAYAASCYAENTPTTPLHTGDVRGLDVGAALELARVAPGKLDILDGSPPCQGFSTAGLRVFDDPRNALWRDYARLLRGFRPRAFVMENVSGLVKGKMRVTFVEILRALKAEGYRVAAATLNAKHFGVPQSRVRLIFVGLREDLAVEPTHPQAETARPRTIRDALGEGVDVGAVSPTTRDAWHGSTLNKRFDASAEPINTIIKTNRDAGQLVICGESEAAYLPAPLLSEQTRAAAQRIGLGDRAAHVPAPPLKGHSLECAEKLRPGRSGQDLYGEGTHYSTVRLDAAEAAPAFTKLGSFLGYVKLIHPSCARGLSIGEAMRLSTYPDEYRFVERDTPKKTWESAWGVIGNSVPPFFMRAIARHVGELLRSAPAR